MLDEHPAFWHTVGFLLPLIGTLGVRSSILAIQGAVSEQQWDEALDTSHDGLERLAQTIADGLIAFGQTEAQEVADTWKKRPWKERPGSGEAP